MKHFNLNIVYLILARLGFNSDFLRDIPKHIITKWGLLFKQGEKTC